MTHENQTLADRAVVLQEIQPGLLGLMDGSVSTLAPIFATAGLTGRPLSAFFVGLAASLGAPLPPVETGARLLRVAKAICNQIRWLGWLRGLDLFKNVPRGS